jgi:hypothetical protein
LLDAAILREIGSDDPQPPAALLQALSCLLGPWLLTRSGAPAMDVLTVMCQARAYVVGHENAEAAASAIQLGVGRAFSDAADGFRVVTCMTERLRC